jgi:hypothetical protein
MARPAVVQQRPSRALATSATLFVAWGLTWAAGVIGLPLLFARGFPPWLLFSERTDAALFGAAPDAIREAQPAAAEVQWFGSHMTGIGVTSAGVAVAAIAWFSLRRGERWALWSLGAAALPVALLYPYAVARYARPRVPLGLGDLQPFALIPLFLVPPAFILGVIGLRHPRRPTGPAGTPRDRE